MSEQKFLKDVENHVMTIKRNHGLSRHISFKKEGSNCYAFSIITEPGVLFIWGDCGAFIFERIPDMFDFFRMSEHDFNRGKDCSLPINPHYWSEKVSDGRERCYEYNSKETFKAVKKYFDDLKEGGLSEEEAEEALEDLYLYDGEYEACKSVSENENLGRDCLDLIVHSPTFSYLWCLRAIVWAIQKFDSQES